MKAIVCPRYGPPEVLQLREVPKPVPGADEVLIRIFATAVTMGDCEMRGFRFPLWLRPLARVGFGFRGPRAKIIGQELAGEIEAAGKRVSRFKRGDQVFAATDFRLGAYAEYKCLSENGALAIKPANVTFEEAAAVPIGGPTALHFLRKGNIRGGEKVLINGAGGGIGTFAVQIARLYGAEVTAVDSAGKLDMLLAIGADHVIDYAKEDFTRNGEKYDVIFDVAGKSPFSRSLASLSENGRYLLGNPGLLPMLRGRWVSMAGSRKVESGAASPKAPDLDYLKGLIEAGKIRTVVDRRFPLEQMAEAHRYVEQGHQKGTVIITVG